MSINELFAVLEITDEAEKRQARWCWHFGAACADARHAGRPAPPKPEFILPDRARSGVIWAHAINAGWQMAEATREV